MYVRATSTRFSRGMSMPAIRAIGPLPLPLLVLRVRADDHHGPVTANDLAVVAARLDGSSDFQRILDEWVRARGGRTVAYFRREVMRPRGRPDGGRATRA